MNSQALRPIRVVNRIARQYPATGGRHLQVHPGELVGLFGVEHFILPQRFPLEDGLARIIFVFRDQTGQFYRHSYVHGYGPQAFWIPPATVAQTHGPLCATPDLSIHTMIDYRKPFTIQIEGGQTYSGQFKYTDVWYDLFVREDALHVKNRFHIGGGQRGCDFIAGDYATLFYKLDYGAFLWRKAAKVVNDDYDFEGADFIEIEPIASTAQIEASPIQVK